MASVTSACEYISATGEVVHGPAATSNHYKGTSGS